LDTEIEGAANTDRSGSVGLQQLIISNDRPKLLSDLGLAELVLTGAWYIWWERRQIVQGERVQSCARSAISIALLQKIIWGKKESAIGSSNGLDMSTRK
jgi:hypothetical protein